MSIDFLNGVSIVGNSKLDLNTLIVLLGVFYIVANCFKSRFFFSLSKVTFWSSILYSLRIMFLSLALSRLACMIDIRANIDNLLKSIGSSSYVAVVSLGRASVIVLAEDSDDSKSELLKSDSVMSKTS